MIKWSLPFTWGLLSPFIGHCIMQSSLHLCPPTDGAYSEDIPVQLQPFRGILGILPSNCITSWALPLARWRPNTHVERAFFESLVFERRRLDLRRTSLIPMLNRRAFPPVVSMTPTAHHASVCSSPSAMVPSPTMSLRTVG